MSDSNLTNGDGDQDSKFTVAMRKQLREDAKRNTERGELSEAIRELFRQMAYGIDATSGNSEIDKVQAELTQVRDRVDSLRRKRRGIDAEIESQESRATRLEERVSRLEERSDKFETVVETLEDMLVTGSRIHPAAVDNDLNADRVITELKQRNPDIPDHAFELSKPHEPFDWRKI